MSSLVTQSQPHLGLVSPKSVPVEVKADKMCMKCELPFRSGVDDDKYRWCLECREKKREKNKRERSSKKNKAGGSSSFDSSNPQEGHFMKFDKFDQFINYISHQEIGHKTDAIFQTVVSEKTIPRFPKNFNFISIGAKTVVKRRNLAKDISDEDDNVMQRQIQAMHLAPVVPSCNALKTTNLVSSPLLSLAGIYIEKSLGLVIINQAESLSFAIQNSIRVLEMVVARLLESSHASIFQLNAISAIKLHDEILRVFSEFNIDQNDSLNAYKLVKSKTFSMLRDIPNIVSQLKPIPKMKTVDQAKILRQKIDEQLLKFINRISSATNYQFARKRRDVSQNGNFVINHYCRQDSHYRKLSSLENRKTQDCSSRLGIFYNSINGDFKIIYSHKEHHTDPNHPQLQHDQIDFSPRDLNIDVNLMAQRQQQQQLARARQPVFIENHPTNIEVSNIDHSNPQWRSYSNVLNFEENAHNMQI